MGQRGRNGKRDGDNLQSQHDKAQYQRGLEHPDPVSRLARTPTPLVVRPWATSTGRVASDASAAVCTVESTVSPARRSWACRPSASWPGICASSQRVSATDACTPSTAQKES